uniref:PNPLA domain-containing protein n=1 Tax=viral metagenome TaxID=1070528 RepID=A0A6C0IXK1_9ZZZZ
MRKKHVKKRSVQFPYDNIIFEGGGVHGLAYFACLQHLDDVGVYKTIKRWGGSSVGTFVAACASCHISPQLLLSDSVTLRTETFMGNRRGLTAIYNVLCHWGAYDLSARFRPWLHSFFERHIGVPTLTFGEITRRFGTDLHITVLDITTMKPLVLSSCTTPAVDMVDAIIAAMSVAIMFRPQKIPSLGDGLYIDAGFNDNMPLYTFDATDHGGDGAYNSRTLGIRSIQDTSVYFADQIHYTVPPPQTFVDYLSHMFSLIIESGQQRYAQPRDAARTYFMVIPHAINSLDFNVSDRDRETMRLIGYEGLKTFLRVKNED